MDAQTATAKRSLARLANKLNVGPAEEGALSAKTAAGRVSISDEDKAALEQAGCKVHDAADGFDISMPSQDPDSGGPAAAKIIQKYWPYLDTEGGQGGQYLYTFRFAMKNKRAAEEIKPGTGAQSGTRQDAGDYGSHEQAMQEQVKELKNSGAEGSEDKDPASNNQTSDTDRKDYTINPNQDPKLSKLNANKAIRVVQIIAARDKKLAQQLMKLAEDGDLGVPLGGTPDSVAAGDEAAAVDAGPPADATPPPAPVAQAAPAATGDTIQIKMQDAIQEKEQEVNIQKQVVDQLKDVMNEVTSSASAKVRTAPAKRAGKEDALPYAGRENEDYKLSKDPDWALYDRDKDETDKATKSRNGQDLSERKDYNRTRGAAKRTAGTGGQLAPNEAPGHSPGPTKEQKEYFNVGDSKDEVSAGTDTTLESPETSRLIDDTRSYLDKRHRLDSAGSTTASISSEERKQTLAVLKAVCDTQEMMDKLAKRMLEGGAVTSPKTKTAMTNVTGHFIEKLNKVGDEIERLLKTSHKVATIRRDLGNVIRQARPLVDAAKLQMMTMAAMMDESSAHRARFDRISPSFKLAVEQLKVGQIDLSELPVKVAEYIKMPASAFEATQKLAMDMAEKMAVRRDIDEGEGMPKFARRLPRVAQSTRVVNDELAGVFDDD
jgi:hypothetical protein